MTDKEIIIDGVDISGCYFLNKGITNLLCTCLSEIDEECKYNSNCYFKQLQRKTQEYEQKEKELKELKGQYKLSCLDCEYKNTKTDADRYLKALGEIEEIVNKKTETSICSECAYNHIPECKDNCMQDVLENILDIINKTKEN